MAKETKDKTKETEKEMKESPLYKLGFEELTFEYPNFTVRLKKGFVRFDIGMGRMQEGDDYCLDIRNEEDIITLSKYKKEDMYVHLISKDKAEKEQTKKVASLYKKINRLKEELEIEKIF